MDVDLIFKIAAIGIQQISDLFDLVKTLFSL